LHYFFLRCVKENYCLNSVKYIDNYWSHWYNKNKAHRQQYEKIKGNVTFVIRNVSSINKKDIYETYIKLMNNLLSINSLHQCQSLVYMCDLQVLFSLGFLGFSSSISISSSLGSAGGFLALGFFLLLLSALGFSDFCLRFFVFIFKSFRYQIPNIINRKCFRKSNYLY
jgi:hypothetical protein